MQGSVVWKSIMLRQLFKSLIMQNKIHAAICLLILLVVSGLRAQTPIEVVFKYDAAGNRVERTYDITLRSASLDKDSTLYSQEQEKEERYESGGGFVLYPNPTAGKIILEIKDLPDSPNRITLSVSDGTGRRIKRMRGGSQFNTIDLSNYQNGVYLLEYRYKGVRKVWKIIKK